MLRKKKTCRLGLHALYHFAQSYQSAHVSPS